MPDRIGLVNEPRRARLPEQLDQPFDLAPPAETEVLAEIARDVQATAMANNVPSTSAGGFPIAIGAIGGTIVGVVMQQPTIGFLAGLVAGIAVAVVIWLRGR